MWLKGEGKYARKSLRTRSKATAVEKGKAAYLEIYANLQQGKTHFSKRCGNCHQLFGEGKKVGPPLDGYERGNLTFWLSEDVN